MSEMIQPPALAEHDPSPSEWTEARALRWFADRHEAVHGPNTVIVGWLRSAADKLETPPLKPNYVPTADEAYRFIASNPITSAQFLVETQKLSRKDSAVSNGRLRDLWKLAGGMIDKKGRAWIEADLLPGLLRIMIDGQP